MAGHYFIALPVPAEIQPYLIETQETFEVKSRFKRWTASTDFHITLLFMGGWEDQKRINLWTRIKEEVSSKAPFFLKLNEVGFFGRPSEPRVLWAGVEYSEELIALHNNIKKIAETHEFPVESRPFTPHITLGKGYRSEKPMKMRESSIRIPKVAWKVDEVVLYKIHPQEKPMYRKVGAVTLS
ncbi:RNA 2',3'-cyclic phosphodiesterase [Alteribacter populi]|uniref:RNA 2',3'-cyclic phosphodiesterase n=1 Tax=Alteribacter populi TaxID=2011011 RepID=UPI000BBB3C3C|nr:RNA 2',3'-cyclic phosphodiesterase [Alteribacter populi]